MDVQGDPEGFVGENIEEDDFTQIVETEIAVVSKEEDFIDPFYNSLDDTMSSSFSDAKELTTSINCQDDSSTGNSEKYTKVKTDTKHRKKTVVQRNKIGSPKLKTAAFSKLALNGLCHFKCLQCSTRHEGWEFFCSHMKQSHNEKPKRADHKMFLSKAILHVCEICSKRILCDCSFLESHMNHKHQMPILEYRRLYEDNHAPKPKDIISKGELRGKQMQTLAAGTLSMNKIGNFCSYKCPSCNTTSNNYDTFRRHKAKNKMCSQEISAKDFYMYTTEVVTHRCNICSKLLLCDLKFISIHMFNHGIKKIGEYSERTGCEVSTSSKIRSKAMEEVFQGAKMSDSIGNLCKYKCTNCGHIRTNWPGMMDHLKKNKHYDSCGKEWFRYLTETVIHQCVMCSQKVLNDRYFIKSHLRKSHGLTLRDYVSKYGIKTS